MDDIKDFARSEAAKYAKSVFFEEFNDIDIFIEDTALGYEKIYREIFKRVLLDEYKLSNVFPLGSKETVKAKCNSDKDLLTRPTLYVIDGDLDLLHNEYPEADGLYSLPFYCIENLLIDRDAICELINEEEIDRTREEILLEFDYHSWLAENCKPLIQLFVEYGIIFKLTPSLPTISLGLNELVSSNHGVVDAKKVEARILKISADSLMLCDKNEYSKLKSALESTHDHTPENLIKYISGKDYLIPLLFMRIRKTTKTKASNLNLKLRLAIKCDISKIMDAKKKIIKKPLPSCKN